jgi:hypothetical protein
MSKATSSTTPRLNLLPDFPRRKLIYHPLNSLAGQIRVIVVLHAAEREAPLRCFLKTISIHEGKSTEPYHALSYYWGPTENPETVEVYGGSREYDELGGSFDIPITSNCALALRQFRAEATTERQRLVLWTDALCINQADVEERSAQVGIMRNIYKAAHSVWMWIGGESLAAEMGLHNLYSEANSSYRSKIFTEVSPNARLEAMVKWQVETVARGDRDASGRLYYRDLATFFSAAYWQRGWIIQEASANNDTYICYGPARYRIVSLLLLSEFLVPLSNNRVGQPMEDFRSQILQMWYCQYTWRMLKESPAEVVRKLPTTQSLTRVWLETMFAANSWHTSDPRDRVNAIMSAMPPSYTEGLQPDYSKSTEDVFISATVHLLRTGRSWSAYQFLAPSGSPYLPSWAMDFTAARPVPHIPGASHSTAASQWHFGYLFDHITRIHDPSLSEGRSRFGADAKTPFRLRQMTLWVLETAGFVVDKVVSVSSLFTATLCCTDDATDVLRAWYRLLSRNKRYTRHNTTLSGRARKWEAFCRTLCIGRVGKFKFDTSHAAASAAIWDMAIYDRQKHPEGMRKEAQEIFKEMESALKGARFIVTRKGRIGVAPREVAVGDSIGILASGDVPFVLRNVEAEDVLGDAYILIGGCYIDGKTCGAFLAHSQLTATGIMFGEAVQEEAKRRYGDKTATHRLLDESDLYLV